jgi:hypothetical protein
MTPGGTFGLEFTSLMATLAVALFVLIAYAVVVGREAGPTPGDMTAMEIVESLRTGWLTDVAKVFSALGSGAFAWGLTAVCAAFLAVRRRWTEFAVLIAGMTLLSIAHARPTRFSALPVLRSPAATRRIRSSTCGWQ